MPHLFRRLRTLCERMVPTRWFIALLQGVGGLMLAFLVLFITVRGGGPVSLDAWLRQRC